MNSDPNPSSEPRRVGRPPYGLQMRDRRRPAAASDSLGWRRYATPVPPEPHPLRGRCRLARPVIIAGLLACVSAVGWSVSLSASGSAPRTALVSMPAPHPVASKAPSSPPAVALRTLPPSAKPKPREKVSKSPRKRHRRAVPVVPRPPQPRVSVQVERRNPTPRVRRAEKPTRIDREPREVSPYASTCEDLFPPSLPEQRLRNHACHLLLG
jgi:hypothetical protein